ncbi:MAG: glutamyl-tRNA reductase [Desulfobacterales bacterium C00003060]|nr:MAG: glutamyl-tRNA reductase [Desulfobacterales bacterium S3730MH5]OEU81355.1 MAG: glutamyl-tRNA reductase [Desulfobacterales bacterium C00003060]OEU85004.1 MAG: glutamyl-tRNA reductase [Desulfobacterales bacterium S5133MH4]
MVEKSEIVVVGLNHKTAPVEVRERLAFSSEDTPEVLETMRQDQCVDEIMLFSTCNRVEFLLATKDIPEAVEAVKDFLADFKKTPRQVFEDALYVYDGDEAVLHIFRVASSLDSMMIGEPQILGQIKEAYQQASDHGTCAVVLNRLMHRSFSVAKRVRTETGIGDHAVSISYAAVELGRKIFGELEGKAVLLIGAGEMAELAVENLVTNRAQPIFVANRTFERGLEIAERFRGTAIRFEEVPDYLNVVDIVISSTGASHYILMREDFKGVMRARKNRPLFLIDIAVPRDIDPEINRISNVYVYDIDDLKSAIQENMEERQKEALRGERIVDEAVVQFRRWFQSLDVVPTIVALREKTEEIRQAELKKTFASLTSASEQDRAAIERLTAALVKKILHDPTLFLKQIGGYKDKNSLYVDITRRLFNLDERNNCE